MGSLRTIYIYLPKLSRKTRLLFSHTETLRLHCKTHHNMVSYLFLSSSSILFWFSLFLVLLFTTTTNALVKLPENITIPAVIVFGDSIVDAGNNDDMITEARCDYPPYGIDFDGGVATGRFSNGKVPTDILGLFNYL